MQVAEGAGQHCQLREYGRYGVGDVAACLIDALVTAVGDRPHSAQSFPSGIVNPGSIAGFNSASFWPV